jgi:hypothetical protein
MADAPAPGRIRGSSADAADPSTPDYLIDGRLRWMLRFLGREFGPLGVALAAARMTDRDALISRLYQPADYQPKPQDPKPWSPPRPFPCQNEADHQPHGESGVYWCPGIPPRPVASDHFRRSEPLSRLVSHVTGKSTDVGFEKPGQLKLTEEAAREIGYSVMHGREQPYLKLNTETRTLELWDSRTDSWSRDLRGESDFDAAQEKC